MERMSYMGLAENLRKRGLAEELVQKLKDERMNGSAFLEADASVFRACGFKAGEICEILKFRNPGFCYADSDSDTSIPDEQEIDAALSKYLSDDLLVLELDEKYKMYTQLTRYEEYKKKNPHAVCNIQLLKPDFVKQFEARLPRIPERQQVPSPRGLSTGKSLRERGPHSGRSSGHPSVPSSSSTVSVLGSASSRLNSLQNYGSGTSSDTETDDLEDEGEDSSVLAMEKAVERFNPPTPPPPYCTLQQDLPEFNVIEILHNEMKTAKPFRRRAFITLLQTGVVNRQQRLGIVQALVRYLYTKFVKDIKSVTTKMREGMAKSLVCTFPDLAFEHRNGTPWAHVFDPAGPSGWIANASRPYHKSRPQRESAKQRLQAENRATKSKRAQQPQTDEYDADQIRELALVNPGSSERSLIQHGMERTFKLRQAERRQAKHIGYFLNKYPQFMSYDGEMIRQEFKMMFPNGEDMCPALASQLEKLTKLPAARTVSLPFNDDVLKALMLISQNLPHDIPLRDESGNSHAEFESILVVLKCQDDVVEFVEKRVEAATTRIQPYLIYQKALVEKRIVKIFLVLDFKILDLKNCSVIRSIDYLIQAYFAFGVRYPLGWRNTFHFLQTQYYQVFEEIKSGRKKTKDAVTSSERELVLKLKGIN